MASVDKAGSRFSLVHDYVPVYAIAFGWFAGAQVTAVSRLQLLCAFHRDCRKGRQGRRIRMTIVRYYAIRSSSLWKDPREFR